MRSSLERALLLLAKLERQRLDRERLELQRLSDEIEAVAQARDELVAGLPREHAAGWAIPGGARLLSGYLAGARERCRTMDERQRALTALRVDAEAKVREGLAARNALETAAERLAAQRASRLAERAARLIDEAALRRAGSGPGAPGEPSSAP